MSKEKKDKHLYRFECIHGGGDTRGCDSCVNCNSAIYYFLSTPSQFLSNFYERVKEEKEQDFMCLTEFCRDSDTDEPLSFAAALKQQTGDSNIWEFIGEKCITDLGVITVEEIATLKKFGIFKGI